MFNSKDRCVLMAHKADFTDGVCTKCGKSCELAYMMVNPNTIKLLCSSCHQHVVVDLGGLSVSEFLKLQS